MKCQKCKKRKATVQWIGTGGVMDAIHGMYENWCKKCCLEAQLEYAEEHKNDYIKLKKELRRYETIPETSQNV